MAQTENLSKLVTVVVPTIEERSELLQEALNSVRNQTAGDVAVIVMHDVQRLGPAEMRNRAVKLVQTPWVQFLDDDDLLHPTYFEEVIPRLDDSDVVYTYCVEDGFVANLDHPWDPEWMRVMNQVPVTACIRVDMFRKVGGFPDNVAYEDWHLWLSMIDAGARFTCVEKKLWTYRRHDGSRTYYNQQQIALGLKNQ